MGIFILISFGVVMVLLIAYLGRKLGGTTPWREEKRLWEEDKIVPIDKGWRESLFEDERNIFEDSLDPRDPSSIAYRSRDD